MKSISYSKDVMASESCKFTLWFLTGVLFMSLALCSSAHQTQGGVSLRMVKGLFRSKRQACTHGTYEHEGRMCCRCGPGTRVERHCSAADQDDGHCQSCEPDTYSAYATAQMTCEPCRSCTQPKANLEVESNCTRAINSKCKCKTDHYCISYLETCRLCSPCKVCGSEGIRDPCISNNNTVCNEKHEGVNAGAIAGSVIGVLIVLSLLAGVVYVVKIRRSDSIQLTSVQRNGNAADVERQPLNELTERHLPDIAGVLGWKDMKDVALRSGMTKVEIDNCERTAPGDPEEQTLQLLIKWTEKEGRGGATALIQTLQKAKHKEKVEKVMAILQPESTL